MTDALNALALDIKTLTGVAIPPEKYYLFEQRFRAIMQEFGIADFSELLLQMRDIRNTVFINRIIDKITTHETSFFRDESIFNALVSQISAEWLQENSCETSIPPLKIWSAASSTGQEAYSIAMILKEMQPRVAAQTKIIATDISEESLAKARRGVYSAFEISRGLPGRFRDKYFQPHDDGFQIKPDITGMVQFQKLNLISGEYPAENDIIFCRNVLIYFAQADRDAILRRMAKSLKKNGILILGSAESLDLSVLSHVKRECGLARYYEVNTENVTMFAGRKQFSAC